MQNKYWKKYQKEIEGRIDKLLKEKYYIEVVFWFSNILEIELKDIIIEHQKAVKFVCQKEKIKFKRLTNKDLEKLTLGQLKNKVEIFTKKDIIKEINGFNKLRVKVIHKIFNNKINDLEKEAIKFTPRFYELTENLLNIKIAIMQNLSKYRQQKMIEEYKKKDNYDSNQNATI